MSEIKRVEPRTLSGFMELLPQEQIKFNEMKRIIEETYELYGFLPQETPIIESSEVLLAKAGGETEKQIYSFTKGDTDLSLRFDLTVPLAKYVAKNYYQCDIDIIGNGKLSIANDAQMPSIIYSIFKRFNFGKFIIRMNNRKILNGLFEEIGLKDQAKEALVIIDKLDKIGMENVKEELRNIGVTEENVVKLEEFFNINKSGDNDEILAALKGLGFKSETFAQGLKEIEELITYVRLFGVEEEYFRIDLTIARGLDYYTGTVYETNIIGYENIGSICSGGRYDNLAEYYTKQNLPGVGISIGLTRLFYVLNELDLIKIEKTSISKAVIVTMGVDFGEGVKVSNALREAGIKNEIYAEDAKTKNKFSYVDNLNIPYCIVIGQDEIDKNMYTLKNMTTGEQEMLSIEDIISKIK